MNADARWVEEMKALAEPGCQSLRIRHRADTIFLLVMGGRVITMQTGFAMLESAFGRQMNSANIMMKNTMDLLVGSIVFFFLGYWIAYGASPHFAKEVDLDYAMWFCQFAYATTAATINSGALAGRVAFNSYLMLSVVLTGVIYPVIVRMTWGGGWLGELGFIDFAGSAVVHMVGAVSAFVSACICGPRIGRYPSYDGGSRLWRFVTRQWKDDSFYHTPEEEVEKAVWVPMRDCNNPVQILFGVFILIIGFLAFNPASTFETVDDADILAARATVITLLFAAGGATSCVLWSMLRTRSTVVTIPDFATSVLGGMVASCACCDVVPPGLSIFLGMFAGMTALATALVMERVQVDDPVAAVAVHGPPGMLGILYVPIFAKPHCQRDIAGLVYGGGKDAWELLGTQVIGILAIAGCTASMTYLTAILIDVFFGLRCGRAAELIGLDFVEHHYDDGTFGDNEHKQAILYHSPVREGLVQKVLAKGKGLENTPTKAYVASTPRSDAASAASAASAGSGVSADTRGAVETDVAKMRATLDQLLDQVRDLTTELGSVKNTSRRRAQAVHQLLEACRHQDGRAEVVRT